MAVLVLGPRLEDGEQVRVVEQQPPTEEAVALSEQATALAERYGDALVRISDVLANTEPRGHLNRIRAILAGLGLPPGPPEPTQGNEWDRATVDEVERIAATLDGDLHLHHGSGQCEPINPADLVRHVLAERFKGAARDTGGRAPGEPLDREQSE